MFKLTFPDLFLLLLNLLSPFKWIHHMRKGFEELCLNFGSRVGSEVSWLSLDSSILVFEDLFLFKLFLFDMLVSGIDSKLGLLLLFSVAVYWNKISFVHRRFAMHEILVLQLQFICFFEGVILMNRRWDLDVSFFSHA